MMDDMSVEGLGLCPASGTSDWIKGQPSGWVPLKLPAAGRGAVAGVEATTPCPRHAMGEKVPRDFSFFSAPRCFLLRLRLASPAYSCPLRAPPPLCSCHLSHQTAPTVLPPFRRLLHPRRHLLPCEPWLRQCPPAPCPYHPHPCHQLSSWPPRPRPLPPGRLLSPQAPSPFLCLSVSLSLSLCLSVCLSPSLSLSHTHTHARTHTSHVTHTHTHKHTHTYTHTHTQG